VIILCNSPGQLEDNSINIMEARSILGGKLGTDISKIEWFF